jgi:tetratricopeptide (TPR) repeat protein
MIRSLAPTLVVLLSMAAPLLAVQEPHVHAPGEVVGRVTFPTSCSAAVQERFEVAVAMLHSFWFDAAEREFREIASADPACAMAHWGAAMTLLANPMARLSPTPERLAAALSEAETASRLGASASERERAYIQAVLVLYRDHPTLDHLTRMKAHEQAMAEVHQRFPEDPEAAAFYARAVVANAPPDDLTFARQKLAATLIEPLFASQPDHPGLAHYIIHAFDAPAIAEQGLDAARRYAEIAPSAPHALHMPSHIFTRLGYWDESIEANRRSAQAEPEPNAAVHPMDYMVYAYLQQGRNAAAKEVVDRSVELPDRFYGGALGYNFTAMRARFALEREAWIEASAVPVPTGALPHVEAVARFARGVGAARSGQTASARPEAQALAEIRDRLAAANDAYWRTIVEAERLAVESWIAWASGDHAEAERLGREAATLEETVEKHPVTPGPLLPARELYADLLGEIGRHADAHREYVEVLVREPRRARSVFGAARAAERAGDGAAARSYYTELLQLMERADPERPEPRAARAYLAR